MLDRVLCGSEYHIAEISVASSVPKFAQLDLDMTVPQCCTGLDVRTQPYDTGEITDL